MWDLVPNAAAAAAIAGGLGLTTAVCRKQLHRWAGPVLWQQAMAARYDWRRHPVHVFIAVCDHYEPEWGRAPKSEAIARVDRWCREYPARFARFADSSGRPPQHTFFFPADEYRPEYLDRLARLCARGFGDVDIHLHHDRDTPDGLRNTLESFKHVLADRHGLLRRDPATGQLTYGFIHGNWALCNSRPDGRWCGVDNELGILQETGCYADFTLPSAPVATQTRTINSIYYAADRPGERKSHDVGPRSRVGAQAPQDHLLLIQGPLRFNWGRRKLGLIPRIENGDLNPANPPSWNRCRQWLDCNIAVAGRPDWLFVKLHTHGAKPPAADMWFGPAVQQFHADLAACAARRPEFRFHYVTAWEMAGLVRQAESGQTVPDFENLRDRPAASSVASRELQLVP